MIGGFKMDFKNVSSAVDVYNIWRSKAVICLNKNTFEVFVVVYRRSQEMLDFKEEEIVEVIRKEGLKDNDYISEKMVKTICEDVLEGRVQSKEYYINKQRETLNMPRFKGSEKQIKWAEQLYGKAVHFIEKVLNHPRIAESDEWREYGVRFLDEMKKMNKARFWIENFGWSETLLDYTYHYVEFAKKLVEADKEIRKDRAYWFLDVVEWYSRELQNKEMSIAVDMARKRRYKQNEKNN